MKLTSRQKSLLNRIATATRVNYGDSPRTAGGLIRLGLVAKASGEALRLTPQGKAEFYAPTMPKLHYFQSEVEPKVGDEISIGKNGRCRVEAIVGGELQARNIHTGELFTVFAEDCDLLGRAELDDQASVVVAKLLAAGRGREAGSLGQIIGAWRKGHVGDCALRNAITGGERRLAQTGTPAVERAQLAEIQ